jgi:hypothetical protein
MKLTDYANPECEECEGEGYYDVAVRDDSEAIPCQKCFPPEKNQLETTWEDLRDDEDRDDGF